VASQSAGSLTLFTYKLVVSIADSYRPVSPTMSLLLFTPIGIVAAWQEWRLKWIVAVLNGVSLIPTVQLHLHATEELAAAFDVRVGGLLVAIAGNIARPIVSLLTLIYA